jgi:hypothetical protein
MATCRVEPGHPNAIPFLDRCHSRPNGCHTTNRLMARNEGKGGLQGPVAVRGVEIGMANPAGLGFYENLTGSRLGKLPLPEHKRFSELFDNGGVHLAWHTSPRCKFLSRELVIERSGQRE